MYEDEIRNRTPILFALSTCPRCRAVKEFLNANNIKARIIDVDLLSREERKEQLTFVQQVNPRLSFPTLIVGDLAVIGADYDGIREALGL
jgi:glutaredoxin-like protein NrdH